ncbi:MAG TPA: adenylate/guanylate cyclase domain-containing protein [Acidimicrobiales bacterium]|nr:adenylate/guanylate cyclase domain-containing protein [Acidimicrobiales bacterium]
MSEDRALPSGIVTFVFTDIEGSTRLLRRIGDRYPSLLDRHLELMSHAWESHGGAVVGTRGDGLFVAFQEADAAVDASAAAQRALSNEPWPVDAELRVRIGVHTGLAAPHSGDYAAYAVHQAARVMSAAHGGQVVVSSATVERLSQRAPAMLRPLGQYRLRDFDSPTHLYQLVGPGLPAAFPAVRAVPAGGHNLVPPATSFHGRGDDVDNLTARLHPGSLVTLIGPGGVGKTRTAMEVGLSVADAWPDGAWLIDLAPISDPGLIAPAVGSALGVPSRGEERWQEILDHLTERQALLIFDNCESSAAHCGQLLEELLVRCPGCAALVTSRVPLVTAREELWRLEPLELATAGPGPGPAIAVFVDRARAVRHDFEPDQDSLGVIAEICRRLDGLPLALELAAARMAVMSPRELLDGLADRFRLLRSANPSVPERQRTLEALLEWSDRLLSAEERRCLRRLAVFGSGFTVEAAVAAAAEGMDPDDVPSLVWSLVDKSLVAADLTANATRYRLLESVREHVRARLDAYEETAATALRLASWYHQRLGPEQRHHRRWSGEVGEELDNLRRLVPLVAPTAPVLAQELAFTIARHLDSVQSFREAIDELQRHIEMVDLPTPAAVSLRTTLADLHLRVGDADAARAALAEAEILLEAVGSLPPWDDVAIERTRGDLACRSGDYAAALEGAASALSRDLSDAGEVRMCSQLGIAAMSVGAVERAAAAFEQQLQACRRVGDPVTEAAALGNLAESALRTADWASAARHQRACLTLALELGAPAMVAFSLIVAARLLAVEHRWYEAVVVHSTAEPILEATGLVLYEDDQYQSDAMLDEARRQLGAATFDAARESGRTVDLPAAAASADRVLAQVSEG